MRTPLEPERAQPAKTSEGRETNPCPLIPIPLPSLRPNQTSAKAAKLTPSRILLNYLPQLKPIDSHPITIASLKLFSAPRPILDEEHLKR
ncbi:hypothetical protein AUP74_02642 [Microbulbifer aggregans]|uniref:Uncharacterized protein n=1 Tax=Microbulbifer aggregans TaxID=1769779 RepID=A0A1C9WA52_9GAMM|nr:hypothetical protein AUP74_02642 [Microbulbifer aggregans]